MPGLSAATTAAIAIITAFEDSAQAPEEWSKFSEQLKRVSVLLSEANKLDKITSTLKVQLEQVEKILDGLKKKIVDENTKALLIFLSADSVQMAKDCADDLEKCIGLLIATLVIATKQDEEEIKQKIDQLIESLKTDGTPVLFEQVLFEQESVTLEEGGIAQDENDVAKDTNARFVQKDVHVGKNARSQTRNRVF